MPRPRKEPRLYLRPARKGRNAVYVILDGAREVGTGCGADERERAEEALKAYKVAQYRPPRGITSADHILISEAIAVYLRERAPKTHSAAWLATMARPLIEWWHGRPVSDICRKTCDDYVEWRTQAVSKATAREELSTLRAAIRFFHAGTPLQGLPVVTLPPPKDAREDYYWSRQHAARRLRMARRNPRTRHVARLILVGLYSGTRLKTMRRLRWVQSLDAGWVDLEAGLIYRRGASEPKTKKSQPPCKIHSRLLPHLRRWREQDMAKGITHVIHYRGQPVQELYVAWEAVRLAAGATREDAPHILRHTSVTWFVEAGLGLAEVSSYVGMSIPTLTKTYWHKSPDFQADIASTAPKPGAAKRKAKAAGKA
jgi:site-specific recombinase XerD